MKYRIVGFHENDMYFRSPELLGKIVTLTPTVERAVPIVQVSGWDICHKGYYTGDLFSANGRKFILYAHGVQLEECV